MHTWPGGESWESVSLYITRPMQPPSLQAPPLFRLNAPSLSGPPEDTVIFSGERMIMASHASGSSGQASQSPPERSFVPADMPAEPNLPFLPNLDTLFPTDQQLEGRQQRKWESRASQKADPVKAEKIRQKARASWARRKADPVKAEIIRRQERESKARRLADPAKAEIIRQHDRASRARRKADPAKADKMRLQIRKSMAKYRAKLKASRLAAILGRPVQDGAGPMPVVKPQPGAGLAQDFSGLNVTPLLPTVSPPAEVVELSLDELSSPTLDCSSHPPDDSVEQGLPGPPPSPIGQWMAQTFSWFQS